MASSIFEEFRRDGSGRFIAANAIERLLKETPCPWILLSYSSSGRTTDEELNGIIRNSGEVVDAIEIDYRRNVMAAMKWTNEWLREVEKENKEFLFLIRK